MSICALGYAQFPAKPVPFNGMVTDMLGNPVKGAKVYVVDQNYFSKSDKKGRFGLTNVLPTDTLHVLYQKTVYDIPIAGRKSIRVRLGDQVIKEAEEDQDLVDLGYSFIKRREQTTPSNGISGLALQRTGKTNLLDALSGLVPGLMISSNGSVGSTPSARIRGISSLNSSTEPLYLVDGVAVDNLDYINIYDVESVEVLKEASIYGSRGANGAILVHTKK